MAEKTLIEFTNLVAVLQEYGKRVEALYRDELIKEGKNASYNLLDSIQYIYQHKGNEYSISLSLAHYWKYIEYGRKPGKFPPIDAILSWVKIKPIIPSPDKNGRIPSPKSLAYLIGRKIANQGIPAQPLLRNAVTATNEQMNDAIIDALHKDLDANMTAILVSGFAK